MFRRFTAALALAALTGPAAAVTLDLEDAVELAMNHDPRISETEHLVDVARALLQEAVGSDDVFLDLNMFLAIAPEADGFYSNGSSNCVSLPCTVATDGDEIDGLSPWADLKFKLIKPLATFGKVENYTEAAQGNVDVKRGAVRLQRIQSRMQVTRAYYGYLTARDSHDLIEDLVRRVMKAKKQMQAAIDEGRGDVKLSDFYALQTGAGILRKSLAQAGAIEATALAGLRLLTGIQEPEPLEVADRHIRPVPLPMPDQSLKEWQDQALSARTEMDQLEAGLRARRALIEAKKAEQLPNVYVGIVGSAAYASERDRLSNPLIYDPFNHVGVTPMVGMQWHWAGGVQSARIAQAEAELNALVDKQSFARLGIPFEVAERYNKVRAGRQGVEEMAEASRAGRRWMLAAYADFEVGSERMDRVIEAFRSYALAHTDYLTTIYDYNVEVAELMRVSGAYR
ncbi:MAG: TolC family protein [Gammaproteobacteria bacterium]|nr:MAG: TolC family protein [Gammaproteobacteria bacterium]